MARGFNSTLGSGSTDVISTGFTAGHAMKSSFFCWLYIRAFTGQLSRVLGNGTAAIYLAVQSGGYQIQFPFSTTNGVWNGPTPSTGAWMAIALTYDGTSTSNKPSLYINGVSQSISVGTAPAGTFQQVTGNTLIGNAGSGTRVVDGMVAEFSIWNGVILSAAEITALSKAAPPFLIKPASLALYCPLYGLQSNEPDWGPGRYTQTITGTKKQNHAPASFWMPPAPVFLPQNFRGSLALTQGAAATALTARQKFRASSAIMQQNSTAAVVGREKFAGSLALTASGNSALIYSLQQQEGHPGHVTIGDAAIGGLLTSDQPKFGATPHDKALFDVTIMESL